VAIADHTATKCKWRVRIATHTRVLGSFAARLSSPLWRLISGSDEPKLTPRERIRSGYRLRESSLDAWGWWVLRTPKRALIGHLGMLSFKGLFKDPHNLLDFSAQCFTRWCLHKVGLPKVPSIDWSTLFCGRRRFGNTKTLECFVCKGRADQTWGSLFNL
jgi:hypothetical protein